jgi:hypothetical protein
VLTSKDEYRLGEPVTVQLEACNPTDHTVLEYYSSPHCGTDQVQVLHGSSGEVVAFSDFGPWCSPWVAPIELDPGECEVFEFWLWNQVGEGSPNPGDGSQVAPGVYLVVGNALGVSTAPHSIEVLAHAFEVPILGRGGLIVLVGLIAVAGALLLSRRC